MKKITISVIKDLIISVLLVACIVIILAILFYDKISLGKVIPELQEYELPEEIEQEIKDSNIEDIEEVVINYYLDAKDLKKYEKTKEYDKGKANPFAVESSTPTNNLDINNNTLSSDNQNQNSGYYEDDGTK